MTTFTTEQTNQQNGHSPAYQEALNARDYIKALLAHEKPDSIPDVGDWIQLCTLLARAYDRNPDNIDVVVHATVKSTGRYRRLKELLFDKPKKAPNVSIDIPPLPEEIRTPKNFNPSSSEAYRLLDIYVKFSKQASPEGYEDFHVFCGLWLLSVVVARRAYVWLAREKIYTNLRIALCAESTMYAKSVTAKVAISCAEEAGLYHLLIRRGKITPEKLMANMTGKYGVPGNYNELTPEKQKYIDRRMAMAGQKGMYWDELGKFLKSMIRENSPMAKYQDLLLELDDCVTNGNDTVGRGDEIIEKPYLTILGSLIPSTMKNAARTGSELWQDGNFARSGFICAPATGGTDDPLSTGHIPAPGEILNALNNMNSWLGEAEVEITMDETSKKPSVEILRELQEHECILSTEAQKAQKAYRSALKQLCNSNKDVPSDLRAGYIRLAQTALRIAMLLACVEATQDLRLTDIKVTLTHWRIAQEFAEILRRNLHTFYAQVSGYKTHASSREDEVIAVLQQQTKNGTIWFTPNAVRRYLNDRLSTEEIEKIMKPLKNTRLKWEPSAHSAAGRYKLAEDLNEDDEQE